MRNFKCFVGIFLVSVFGMQTTRILRTDFRPQNFFSDIVERSTLFDDFSLLCCDSEASFSGNSHTFTFLSDKRIVDIEYEGDAILNSWGYNGRNIVCEIGNIQDENQIRLIFKANDEKRKSKVISFIEKSKNLFYSSSISKDTAKISAGQNLTYSLENLEDYDYQVRPGQPLRIGASGSISGTVRWTDHEGHTYPLSGALIRVDIDGSLWHGEVYTNQNGCYSISYSNIWYIGSGKPTVSICAQGANVKVHYDGLYSQKHTFSNNNQSNTYSYTFSPIMDGNIGKAMMLFQGAQEFSKQATILNNGVQLPMCIVYYPYDSGCYYKDNIIYIEQEVQQTESYFQWDVLGHEYGHHISKSLGFDDSHGGYHSGERNNIDEQIDKNHLSLQDAKDHGLKLAWSEGFATYFSITAQEEFPNVFKNIQFVGDTYMYPGPYATRAINIDEYTEPYGDGFEYTISRILYKMISPLSSNDQYDFICLTKTSLFSIIKTNKPKRFDQFIQHCYIDLNVLTHHIGLLLGRFSVATNYLSIYNNYINTTPTLRWSTNKGCEAFKYNEFDLIFENSNGDVILRIFDISINTTDVASYTLTQSQWTTVKTSYGVFRVFVVSRQTQFFTTGNYWSQLFEFNTPDSYH